MRKFRKWIAVLLSVVFIAAAMAQPAFAFLFHKSKSIVNQFLPMEYAVNDLVISKKVEHPFGDKYSIPDTLTFDFEVNLGPFYANKTVKTTDGDKEADKNGVITVSVKPGASVGVNGIDEETVVTVKELQNRPGFAAKDNETEKTVIISATDVSEMEFVNVYTPAAVAADILSVNGVKILEGRDWQDGDIFEFLLEQQEDDGDWVSLGTASVEYDSEDKTFNHFDFNELIRDIEFDKIGDYKFRMSEVKGDLENVDYDQNVNQFTVTVSDDDMDGALEISRVNAWQNAVATEADGKFDVTVTFNNTFKPLPVPEDITFPITVEKTVVNLGKETIGPEGFEFVLENLDTAGKMTALSDESGKAMFEFTFTADDVGNTYELELTETDGGREGVTYSTDVYEIEIYIDLNDDNELVADVLCNGIDTVNIVAKFENTYDDGTSTEVPTETTVTDTEEPPVTTEEPQKPAPPTGNGPNYAPYIFMVAIGAVALIVIIRKRRETV